MMQISLSELKNNAGKFVMLANEQDILITKNGKVVAKLVTAKADKVAAAKEMFTLLPKNASLDVESIREERLR